MIHSADLAERITDVLSSRREILEAYLFGSHARGEGRVHSDIDIATHIAASRGRDQELKIQN